MDDQIKKGEIRCCLEGETRGEEVGDMYVEGVIMLRPKLALHVYQCIVWGEGEGGGGLTCI